MRPLRALRFNCNIRVQGGGCEPTSQHTDPGIHDPVRRSSDVPVILRFVKGLAKYEKLTHEVTATEPLLRETLFGSRRVAEVMIGDFRGASRWASPCSSTTSRRSWVAPASTWKTSSSSPEMRGRGFGKASAHLSGEDRRRAGLRPRRVGGAGLERAVDPVLQEARRGPDGRVDRVPADRGGARRAGERLRRAGRPCGDGGHPRLPGHRRHRGHRQGHRTTDCRTAGHRGRPRLPRRREGRCRPSRDRRDDRQPARPV